MSLLVLLATSLAQGAEPESFWPQWRGPLANGVAPAANPPTKWGEEFNVRWKLELPGKGHSTPIVWGDRVFVTAAVPVGPAREPVYNQAPGAHDNHPVTHEHEYVALAVARKDGRVLWRKALRRALPHEGGHFTGSLASHSPTTDGRHLYVSFGSQGIYCLDFEGKEIWRRDLGRMDSKHAHGEGSSPVLHGDTLVVNWDHEGDSFLVALDKHTGKELWQVARDEATSWSTPLVVVHAGKPQVVVSATKAVRGYDLATGKVIWECRGLANNVVASPVAGDGLVFAGNSYDWQAMLAIRLAGAAGDITETTNVVWKISRLTPYVPSPLLFEDTLYFLRHNHNILSALNPRTGEDRAGPFRLPGLREIFGSPVAAAGRIYISDRSGATLVFRAGPDPQPLALNRLDDSFSASAALAGGELYLRGEKRLYCLAEPEN